MVIETGQESTLLCTAKKNSHMMLKPTNFAKISMATLPVKEFASQKLACKTYVSPFFLVTLEK